MTQLESSVDDESGKEEGPPAPADFAVKVLQLDTLSLELGSCLPRPSEGGAEGVVPRSAGNAVPIAVTAGEMTLKVTIRQAAEAGTAPKVEVDGFLGTLHLLLSPQQLNVLQELAESLVLQGR